MSSANVTTPGCSTLRRSLRAFAITAVASLVFGACHKGAGHAGDSKTASTAPATLDVLKLMPEGTVVATAIPSIDIAEAQVHALLMRGAPEDVDMGAEIKVVTSQLARSANAFEAASLADIAAIKGIDPEKPLAIFFGASKEDDSASTSNMHGFFGYELLSTLGIESLPPLAVVLPYVNRQDTEKLVVELGGTGPMTAADFTEPNATMFTRSDGGFAYFFTDAFLVAGTSPELVRGVADRMQSPARIRYGTPECPAESRDEFVQLVRTDLQPPDLNDTKKIAAGGIPHTSREAIGLLWRLWTSPARGGEPAVLTWKFANDRLSLRSRVEHPRQSDAQQPPGQPAPLSQLDKVPKSALGAWTVRLTTQTRETLKAMVTQNIGAHGGMLAQMGDSLETIIDATGGEATLAITGAGADASEIAALIEFKNGDEARSILHAMGMTSLKAETYNNTDIFTFFFPPVTVYYALPKNTLVIAGNMDSAKDLIDAVTSKSRSAFANSLNPPLDTSQPREQVFAAKREMFTDALLPALKLYGTVSDAQVRYAAKSLGKVRDARITAGMTDNWYDTRAVVQFD